MNVRMISTALLATAAVAAISSSVQPAAAVPLGTTFTYQGQLQQSGAPANGTCDFLFTPWDAVADGSPVAPTSSKLSTTVTNGLFTVELDFGGAVFAGEDRYLDIQVRCPAGPC